jgi:hypothetical protein
MKSLFKISILFPAVILICGILVFYPAIGADEKENIDTKPPVLSDLEDEDSVFTEIHVTPEGAYGVDSLDGEWEYDFSSDKFIKEDESDQTTRTTFRKRDKTPARPADQADPALIIQPDEGLYINPRKLAGLKIGAVEVKVDEKVKGSIVAVGPVTVKGMVQGDVTSYKKITVTSTGRIMGDARAPKIEKMRGGYIGGQRYETVIPVMPEFELIRDYSYTAFHVNLTILICLLLAGLLAVAIAPQPIERIKTCLQVSFAKSFFVGFLIWIAYGPFFGLLCLTIIGIPVAVLALPLITLLAVILAIVGISQWTGEKFSNVFGGSFSSRLGRTILGILILESLWILFSLFYASSSTAAQGLSTAFLVVSIVVWSIGLTAGMGAILLTRFGSRDCKKMIDDVDQKEYMAPPPPPTPPPLSGSDRV